MKNLLLGILLILSSCSLNGSELIFDLLLQDYQNTLDTKKGNAKYKINENITFETNLHKSKKKGFYYSESSLGRNIIEINKPIKNWKLNIEFALFGPDKKRNVTFYDTHGNIKNLEFSKKSFLINEKEFEADLAGKYIILEIMNIENTFSVVINNQRVYQSNVDLNELKKISTTYRSSYANDELYKTELYLK